MRISDWSSDVCSSDLYVRTLRLRDNYPGIRAMGYVSSVAPQDLDAFMRSVRQESPAGFSNPLILRDFKLRAPPPPIEPTTPAVHAVVLYTEPLTADSERALGIDMMQDAGRRAVLEAAVRSEEHTSELQSLMRISYA